MKTAISLPDELFERAETAAKQLELSRSELYALALGDVLRSRDQEAVAKNIREYYAGTPVKVDPAFHKAQLKVMKRVDW
jgi:metal-responsive CopG/Arc/MetJ family transcriptional regulator